MKQQSTYPGPSLTAILLALSVATSGCAEAPPIAPSRPPRLSSLAISPGELTPAFVTTTMTYAATVPTDLPSIVVLANTEDLESAIAINGQTIPPGAKQSVSLGPPGMSTPVEVQVVPSNGGDPIKYMVTVARRAKCTPATGEDCCAQDYQERPCGNGNCGKQSRTCSAAGKWGEWAGCGVDIARNGQVCRAKATVCDPAEFCDGAAVDCVADYVEYSLPGYGGCWQNISSPEFNLGGVCYLPPPPDGYSSCKPNDEQTADHICVTRGYKAYKRGTIVNEKVVSDRIGWVVWNGSGWQREAGSGGNAMTRVTCLK